MLFYRFSLNRIIIIIIAASLLVLSSGSHEARAAVPGSADDPLVTKSFLESYISNYYASQETEIQKLAARIAELEQKIQELEGDLASRSRVIILRVGNPTAFVGTTPFTLPQPPVLEGGRVWLPFRFIGEALGAEVRWEAASQKVEYVLGPHRLQLTLGSRRATTDGREVELEAAPRVVNGVTIVPVRVVSTYLGANVAWNETTQEVTITPGK
ncbi:MAG: copper amine oxidase N-terminal domain-containing protein [Clostridia bacterium]|nr:MAG: copper amine oxidase N-terminal domain-containing protein [Clostridia bacterium]